ncbi:TIGR00269 family protein [Acidianus manzaensis]|uniref:TIGR00269 family protein n=1 Tax=Acidianus manzaensis TaxID=282676 RepID=A0A1W6K1B7_9CREN|nr:TIGR00269 family protein [Acidianus manzaensis]ARM76299.1 TIGR00269 family protein [Acidianus manzaensis]
MKCDICKSKDAVIYQPYSGRRLCKDCFIDDVRRRVREEAEKQGILKANKVLLAVSGGKDSLTLADTLASIVNPKKLIAFNIVEGISGYNRKEAAMKLKKYLDDLGIELISSSFKEEVGYSLDEMISSSKNRGLNIAACTFCGGFRRKLINNAGWKVKADLVATGHNLDDEAQTIIVNLLRGDIKRLVRLGDVPLKLSDRFVLRVKPLRKVYEWETTMYAYFKGFEFQDVECPYISQKPTLRARVRDLLYLIEEKNPGSLMRIVEEFDLISDNIKNNTSREELPRCKICGDPTSYGRDICKNCELLIKSGLMDQKYLFMS